MPDCTCGHEGLETAWHLSPCPRSLWAQGRAGFLWMSVSHEPPEHRACRTRTGEENLAVFHALAKMLLRGGAVR